jgi:hypothetical protein
MIGLAALWIGVLIGMPVGWYAKTVYLRKLHRLSVRIRAIQRGTSAHRRRH